LLACQTMAQHDPVSKQSDVNLQGEVVHVSLSCELVESHYGPLHMTVVHLLAVPCLSFGISAPTSQSQAVAPPCLATHQNANFWTNSLQANIDIEPTVLYRYETTLSTAHSHFCYSILDWGVKSENMLRTRTGTVQRRDM
jgi:hypothetical protein